MTGRTLIHNLRHALRLDSPETQTTAAEQNALCYYAAGAQRAVEIGVFEGCNTRRLAEAIDDDGILYAIDPFFPGRLGVCWSEFVAHREVRRSRCGHKVRFIAALSHDATEQVDGDFDFIFVDGDHSLDGIRIDWSQWASRVAPDGIIALHDTRVPSDTPHIRSFGSYQFFESDIRHDPRFELVEQIDSLSVLRRRYTD